MKGGATFRGSNLEQDSRFKDKHAKLLKQIKFPKKFEIKVKKSQFKLEPLRPWITKRVTELLGMEDDVVTEYAITLLEGDILDAKDIQLSLQGFMYSQTEVFVSELWDLLIEAQATADGIPPSIRAFNEAIKREAEDRRHNDRDRGHGQQNRVIHSSSKRGRDHGK